jgi:hypothetical protein
LYPTTHTFDYGTTVVIEALPAPGYHFTKWGGEPTIDQINPINLQVTRNVELTAFFTLAPNAITSSKFASADGVIELFVPDGTAFVDTQGNPVIAMDFSINTNPPTFPGGSMVDQAYDLEPEGATFYPPITLTWNYQSSNIPVGVDEDDLYIAYYSAASSEWIALESDVDAQENIISTSVSHLTTFALLAPQTSLTPPAFEISSLRISPNESDVKAPVTIRVLVANTGETDGSYMVTLNINGEIQERKWVKLTGKAQSEITFITSQRMEGNYLVDVNGLTGSFTVNEGTSPPAPPSTPGEPSPTSPETPAAPAKPAGTGPNWVVLAPIIVGVFLAVFIPLRMRHRKYYD